MATQSIDINYLISSDTEMDYFNNEIALIDKKSDLIKIEKALRSIDILGLHREDAKIVRTKLGNIKRKIENLTKSSTVNPLTPIMVKIQDTPKPTTPVNKPKNPPPKISLVSHPDTMKNTGNNYKHPRISGQGNLFADNSKYKYTKAITQDTSSIESNEGQSSFDFKVKKARKPRSKISNVMSQTEIDQEIARMQKLGDGVATTLELTTKSIESVTKKVAPLVKRVTKMQKDLLVVRQLEASNKTKHNEILENKHKIDKNYNNRKFRNDENDSLRKFEGQQLAKESRENIENTKLKRLKLSTKAKLDLAQSNMDDKVRIHKIDADAKLKVANTHARNRLNLAESNTKNKIALVKANTESKLRIQQKRTGQVNRSQMQRDLHGVHPALGALYGYQQDKKQKEEDDGTSSALVGGVAGAGVFGASKAVGGILAKGIAKKIPVIGSILVGALEYQKSGDVGKSLASGVGALVGGAALGAAAGFISGGPVGAVIGAVVGSYIGETQAKQMYDKFFDNTPTTSTTTNAKQFLPESGRFASSNAEQNRKNGFNSDGGRLDVPNGKGFQAVNGRDAQRARAENTKNGFDDNGNFIGLDSKVAKVSSSGEFLAKAEGSSLTAYSDGSSGGIPMTSIGRGHQIKSNEFAQGYIQAGDERVPISGPNGMTTKLTKDQESKLYDSDKQSYSAGARKSIGADRFDKLNKNQQDALVSYQYNVGNLDGLKKQGLLDKIDSGDLDGASMLIRNGVRTKNGIFNKGVDSRRESESKLYKEKAPSMVKGLKDADASVQLTKTEVKSQPVNVAISNGGSTGGTTVVNNISHHAPNTDSTVRQLNNHNMHTARGM